MIFKDLTFFLSVARSLFVYDHILHLCRYTQLRYEDLLEDPMSSLKNMFLDLNLKFDKKFTNSYLAQAEKRLDKVSNEFQFFDIFRGTGLKHLKWQQNMSVKVK